MSSPFSHIAIVGDPYVRQRIRESHRLGFRETRQLVPQGECACQIAPFATGTLIDLGDDFDDAPAAVRTAALVSLGVDLVVLGYTAPMSGVARYLTEAHRAGVCDVIGVQRTGTHASVDDDNRASLLAEQAFVAYARWVGFVRVRSLLRAKGSISSMLETFVGDNERSTPVPPTGERHILVCAECNVAITSAVQIEPWEALGDAWFEQRTSSDESVVPPGHAVVGDGVAGPAYFTLKRGVIYVNEADLIWREENGRGVAVTCCGARPDPTQGPNLECARGHPIGELWTDCCSPQGAHLDLSRLVIL